MSYIDMAVLQGEVTKAPEIRKNAQGREYAVLYMRTGQFFRSKGKGTWVMSEYVVLVFDNAFVKQKHGLYQRGCWIRVTGTHAKPSGNVSTIRVDTSRGGMILPCNKDAWPETPEDTMSDAEIQLVENTVGDEQNSAQEEDIYASSTSSDKSTDKDDIPF